jgi:hypothetical protein
MTTLNALGFFLLGVLMIFVPAFFPASFAANALDGSSTSALWLGVMGLFQGSMGAFFIMRNEAAPLAVRLMTLRLPTLRPAERRAPAMILRPLQGGYIGGQGGDERIAA